MPVFGVNRCRVSCTIAPRGDVHFVDIGPARRNLELPAVAQIVQHAVINPLPIETDDRILHRPFLAAANEHFLRPIRMQQHQIRPRLHEHRPRDLGIEFLVRMIPGPMSADIDDIVVVLDARIIMNRLRMDVDRIEIEFFLFSVGERPRRGSKNRDERERREKRSRRKSKNRILMAISPERFFFDSPRRHGRDRS